MLFDSQQASNEFCVGFLYGRNKSTNCVPKKDDGGIIVSMYDRSFFLLAGIPFGPTRLCPMLKVVKENG